MKIVFFSKTGNIKRFTTKIKFETIQGNEKMIINENFILITYTIGFGEVPHEVETFLNSNHKFLRGVVGSGNKNWGIFYCNACNIIHKKYNVPIYQTFELSGNTHAVTEFENIYTKLLKEEENSN